MKYIVVTHFFLILPHFYQLKATRKWLSRALCAERFYKCFSRYYISQIRIKGLFIKFYINFNAYVYVMIKFMIKLLNNYSNDRLFAFTLIFNVQFNVCLIALIRNPAVGKCINTLIYMLNFINTFICIHLRYIDRHLLY